MFDPFIPKLQITFKMKLFLLSILYVYLYINNYSPITWKLPCMALTGHSYVKELPWRDFTFFNHGIGGIPIDRGSDRPIIEKGPLDRGSDRPFSPWSIGPFFKEKGPYRPRVR